MTDEPKSFDEIKRRLEEIASEVSKDGISLDDAIALYEEAVQLGLSACDVSEEELLDAGHEALIPNASCSADDEAGAITAQSGVDGGVRVSKGGKGVGEEAPAQAGAEAAGDSSASCASPM